MNEPAGRSVRNARYDGFRIVVAMAALMWALELVDQITNNRLDDLGIEPREADGLVGVAASPFLHADFGHLMANTVPFLVMGFAIAIRGAVRVIQVTVIVALVSGLGTWLTGPELTNHIGASGVVFGYGTYVITQGFFDRDFTGIAIGLVIAFVFGGALLGGLVPEEGVSWQGHFFGAVGGVLAARLLARDRDGGDRPAAPAY